MILDMLLYFAIEFQVRFKLTCYCFWESRFYKNQSHRSARPALQLWQEPLVQCIDNIDIHLQMQPRRRFVALELHTKIYWDLMSFIIFCLQSVPIDRFRLDQKPSSPFSPFTQCAHSLSSGNRWKVLTKIVSTSSNGIGL